MIFALILMIVYSIIIIYFFRDISFHEQTAEQLIILVVFVSFGYILFFLLGYFYPEQQRFHDFLWHGKSEEDERIDEIFEEECEKLEEEKK